MHVIYGHGSVLLLWLSDMLCSSNFMDDVMFGHNDHKWAIIKWHILKVTQQGAAGFDTMLSAFKTEPPRGSTGQGRSLRSMIILSLLSKMNGTIRYQLRLRRDQQIVSGWTK